MLGNVGRSFSLWLQRSRIGDAAGDTAQALSCDLLRLVPQNRLEAEVGSDLLIPDHHGSGSEQEFLPVGIEEELSCVASQ